MARDVVCSSAEVLALCGCSSSPGEHDRQVKAIRDEVEARCTPPGGAKPKRVEGSTAPWVSGLRDVVGARLRQDCGVYTSSALGRRARIELPTTPRSGGVVA